ncbi:CI-like repressor%2C phage associated [Streptococcus pneumoniae]|uniref:XRE family transcriptional regulator n=1 Tax=Streptococcus pneumoniae TaxID=1313 RepID=UPI00076530EF|nr:S24 family peptidase [Streptococcus pneumoniae]CVO42053.1 CI-like repressor%2C phage associated [Streptococcus pneumoniae]CVP42871.1 CI-like repressor%2C phage associated [Streptococcus pneumoniae]CVS45084.1 CI-like repressor%2C phage associated [Streptococcus pneumoniae]CVT85497.1 CI-like repressor%2C phage associated [Streptococcus pneumoniae]CVV39042.1 CI-like repressor%2C phage associated [Streptococcus pneumoniae]
MDEKKRMQIIAENITHFRKQRGITQKELAKEVGITASTMTDYMKLRSAPSFGVIQKLADYFGVKKSDIDTTFKEESTNSLPDAPDSLTQQIMDKVVQLTPPNQKIVLRTSEGLLESQNEEETKINEVSEVISLYQVEVVSETAAASGFNYGFGYDDTDRETIEVDERPPRHDIATKVSGDSMQPDYQDGDILYLVDKGLTTYNGDLAVIAYGDRSYFKKIYTENGRLRLVSLNDKYEDIILDFPPAEDTHIKIYAVVGVYRGE